MAGFSSRVLFALASFAVGACGGSFESVGDGGDPVGTTCGAPMACGAAADAGAVDASAPETGGPEGGAPEAGKDAAHPDGGTVDATPESGGEAGADASVEAGADASMEAGGDAGGGCVSGITCTGSCTPGATHCAGSEVQMCGTSAQWGAPESDPIWAVEASAGGGSVVMNYDGSNGEPAPTPTGAAPEGEAVTFDVWTAPGVSSASVSYWLNGDSSDISTIPLTITSVNGSDLDTWTGALPAQSSGTTVTWWAEGTDVCHAGTDFYSNAGKNYVYTTQ